jgi:hypothetical protein
MSFEFEKELTTENCPVDTKIIDDANNVHIYLGLGLCLRGVVIMEGIIVLEVVGWFESAQMSGLGFYINIIISKEGPVCLFVL